jgi:hypothetical protein
LEVASPAPQGKEDEMVGERELRGVWTRGDDPKELVLSDGSRLLLRPPDQGPVGWRRRGDARDGGERPVSLPEALELAGEDFAGYVTVRTRAEAQWLREIAAWCGREADRLEGELARAG